MPDRIAGHKVLSVLRLRNWRPCLPFLARISNVSKLYMYDQDPWEGFHDQGACKGIYDLYSEYADIQSFLITSKWWSDFVAEQTGATTNFVRMGAVEENCSVGQPFSKRRHEIGFQGTVHPHRRQFFEELARNGIRTDLLERVDFETFLETVQEIGIYLYDDHETLTINGSAASYHGLWGKCLTVAARGCFVIRNDDLSRVPYEIDEIPTVFTYRDKAEIPDIVAHIRAMSDEERWDRMNRAVEIIRNRSDWETVVHAIKS